MRQFVLLLAGMAAVTSASFGKPAKPNGTWEHVSSGVLPLNAAGHLRVITPGAVVIRGAAVDQIRYALQVRADGVTRDEALRLAKGHVLRSRKAAAWTELTVSYPGRVLAYSQLEIVVPLTLQHLIVKAQTGDVEAYDIGGRVEATSGGGKVQLDRIGGDVTARTGGGEIRLGRVTGSVRCLSAGGSIQMDHAGGESWFETSGGDIYLRETVGPIHASTAGGSIRVENAGATVSAHTAGGRIEVRRAAGMVTAGNTGGSIHVGQADGVRCETSGGTIRLRGSAGSLRAIADVGSILAELMRGATLEDSILSTGAGDITVFIPSNLSLTVRAVREAGRAGRIVSEFDEIPVRPVSTARSAALRAEGSLNGGGPLLQISVGGGTIYLRRIK
jgi:hypothetical protein